MSYRDTEREREEVIYLSFGLLKTKNRTQHIQSETVRQTETERDRDSKRWLEKQSERWPWGHNITIMIIMESYAAPKLSKYTTPQGTYDIKSFTYEINQHMHTDRQTDTHTHTHMRACAHTCTHTQSCINKYTHTHTHTHREKERERETERERYRERYIHTHTYICTCTHTHRDWV